jgi:hypothetical protein
MSAVPKDETMVLSVAGWKAVLLVVLTVVSWECPLADLRAARTAVEWGANWIVWMVAWMAETMDVHWV